MAATAVGGGLMRTPVPAGSASHWRATGGGLAGSGFTQCSTQWTADSGANSGTSDALGHSGTGVVGEVGVEEVLVVVVVLSRYH